MNIYIYIYIYIYIRWGTQKFMKLLKKIFKVIIQVWNFSPFRNTPPATGCNNPSNAPMLEILSKIFNGNAAKSRQRIAVGP